MARDARNIDPTPWAGYESSVAEEDVFFEVRDVPANSVLLMRTLEQAQSCPLGDIQLTYNSTTGFIRNRAFAEELVTYSSEYEETQAFSGTFSAFHKRLARDLVDRYDLLNKNIIEIGCGKGEFLILLCELGDNHGLGFDPAYHHGRYQSTADDRVEFITDFYSERYSHLKSDFVCCKMTLEHIPDVAKFVRTIRKAIGGNADTTVFFQVPEVRRILKDLAFWDIYHEHCSYFSKGSIGRLFRSEGFEVLNVWTDYDDQYLMIEARPTMRNPAQPLPGGEADLEDLRMDVDYFRHNIGSRLLGWRKLLSSYRENGMRVWLWGGGSKAVAFLTTLGVTDEIEHAIDINPFKTGTYLAKTGQKIIGPESLTNNPPDVLIVLNPIYSAEIQAELDRAAVTPKIVFVDADPSKVVTE